MRYRVKVEWENEDGTETAELGQVEAGPCLTDVGLKLAAAQEIMARLQRVMTT